MRECLFKLPFWLNDLLHSGQWYLTSSWIFLWWKRPLFLENVFGHKSQDICFPIFNFNLLSRLAICSRSHIILQVSSFPFTTKNLCPEQKTHLIFENFLVKFWATCIQKSQYNWSVASFRLQISIQLQSIPSIFKYLVIFVCPESSCEDNISLNNTLHRKFIAPNNASHPSIITDVVGLLKAFKCKTMLNIIVQ